MKWIITVGCLIWSLLALMIGWPSIRLADGGVWMMGTLGLVVIVILPWGLPLYLSFKKPKVKVRAKSTIHRA